MDIFFQFSQLRCGKCLDGSVLLKQSLRYDIDSCIGTLGTQDHRDQKLPRSLMIQITSVIGAILLIQKIQNIFYSLISGFFRLFSRHRSLFLHMQTALPSHFY